MENTSNKDTPVVRLRAFRAIDDPKACELFLEGHAQVLSSIGITKVTSSKNEWVENPAAFVLIVESLDKQRVYGGARVHVSGGSQPLPIEQATASFDKSIYDLVWRYAQYGSGEICGLWNSRDLAGFGIGTILLIRAGVAVAYQIGLKSLFALCAPYTIKPVEGIGMELEPSVGKDGTFYYPKQDLIATAMILKDLETLSKAGEEERNAVFAIRENLNIVKTETLRNKDITIHYETEVPNLDKWNLGEVIADAERLYYSVRPQAPYPEFRFS